MSRCFVTGSLGYSLSRQTERDITNNVDRKATPVVPAFQRKQGHPSLIASLLILNANTMSRLERSPPHSCLQTRTPHWVHFKRNLTTPNRRGRIPGSLKYLSDKGKRVNRAGRVPSRTAR